MNDPRISVIVPTHNGAPWLRDCLASVFAQTCPPAEIIVVNDGSTDTTADLLREFESCIRVVHQKQGGIGAARNRGVAEASGAYLAFLDHDDLWMAGKLARQLALAHRDPQLDVIFTDAEEFGDDGVVHSSFLDLFPRLRHTERLFEAIVQFSIPLMSTVLLKADFLKRHRLSFYEPASGVDDIGLFLEILARGGHFGLLHECLARRRLHERNLSKAHHHRFEKRALLYRYLLDRLAHATPEQKRMLRWALRHAHWEVGESHWGRLDLSQARHHLDQAIGFDSLGRKALLFALAARLPVGVARGMQWAKRFVLPHRM